MWRDVGMREVGIQDIHKKIRPTKVELIRRDYAANGGYFLSKAFMKDGKHFCHTKILRKTF